MSHAEKFVELLENGKFKKPILSNCQGGTGNGVGYKYFANTFAFDEVMKVDCPPYRGDEID